MLVLAGATISVALGLGVLLPDPCRSVTPAPELVRVDRTWRDHDGRPQLWIGPHGDAFARRACAD